MEKHSAARAEFDQNRVINLGLDPKGGIHMVLRFDINDLPLGTDCRRNIETVNIQMQDIEKGFKILFFNRYAVG